MIKPSKTNPYKNRRLPVGDGYVLPNNTQVYCKEAMLELGEQEFIYDIPRLVGGGALANLGCAQGGSALLLAQGLQDNELDGTVHTVDIYPKDRLEKNIELWKKEGCTRLIIPHKMTTLEASQMYERIGLRFNFVFIDAGHDYDSVKKDFIQYLPLVKTNGIIAFHDTNQDDVSRVIEKHVDVNPFLKWIYWVNRIKAYKVL